MGLNDVTSEWYLPFSMASKANLTKKGFPVKSWSDKVQDWIGKMAEALSGG